MKNVSRNADDVTAVRIAADSSHMNGDLTVPADAAAVIIFAHGSGSGRFSSRNRYVARLLNEAGFATLLMDLLTEAEGRRDELTAEYRFDIPLLARRVIAATRWTREQSVLRSLPVGYFGASTGAAAALIAAAELPAEVFAVVSRGGRPDLAASHLRGVRAPTLLIVGGDDEPVIGMNRSAADAMTAECRVEIIPGATHLFEEPGKLDEVARLAADWFAGHVGRKARSA